MAIITAITEQKNKERCNIFLDGKFYCGLMAQTVVQFKLKEGREIEQIELDRIIKESESLRAFERAVVYLGLKPRTQREIRTYLSGKGFEERAVDIAIERLMDYSYIDDLKYARDFVNQSMHKYGRFMLRQKLFMRGIEREIIDEVLNELCSDDVLSNAIEVAQKYMSYKDYDKETKQRLMRFLAGRGFDFDICKRATNQVFEENFNEDEFE